MNATTHTAAEIVVDPVIVEYAKTHSRKETLLYNNRIYGMYLNPSQRRKDEYDVNWNWILDHFKKG